MTTIRLPKWQSPAWPLSSLSSLATMFISRVRKSFGGSLQLRDVFDAPTVSSLSRIAARRVIEEHESQSIAQLLEDLPDGGLSAASNP